MAKMYSVITGDAFEVSDYVFSEAKEFEASERGKVLMNLRCDPIPFRETHMGMMRTTKELDFYESQEALKVAEQEAEAERAKLEPPPLNAEPGKDWSDLIG